MSSSNPLASVRTLEKLEYNKILQLLAQQCSSESGKELARSLLPSVDKDEVLIWQNETAEALQIRRSVFDIPLGGIVDIQDAIVKLERGGSISIEEFLRINRILYASRRMKEFLSESNLPFNIQALKRYTDSLQVFPELEKTFKKIFDDEGQIQDHASQKLSDIRRTMEDLQHQIKTRLDRMIRQSSMQPYLQENLISIRNGRYVLPVKAAYRQKVPGVVHDQSASGATMYIEPMAIVQPSQDMASLEVDEVAEIQRILDMLAGQLSPYAKQIGRNWEMLAKLDLIFAKAGLSEELECDRPGLGPDASLQFFRARHPLIDPEEVVPIDVNLGLDYDCLVITGPNTGGKTVTLKTIGLLILMHQAGLQIPTAIGSSIGFFKGIYADIGDEQSIEQSLSTFSSHFTNIRQILSKAGPDSLILYDELGAGTDPDEGAALAVAILEHSMSLGAKVVATTHYGELKNFAFQTPRVQNASVEFDISNLRPTYRLMMGVSGNSNAFEISARIGIDSNIIQRARDYMDEKRTESERLLENLEESQYALDQERRLLRRQQRDLDERESILKEKELKLENSCENILTRAREQAAQVLIDAKRDAEGVSRELKSLQKLGQLEAEQKASSLSRKLSDKAYELRKSGQKQTVSKGKIPKKLEIGQTVHLNHFQQNATVLSLPDKKGDFQVQAGIIKIGVNIKDISLAKETSQQSTKQRKRASGKKNKVTPIELDIRGLTVDEALPLLDKYLDDAYLQGLPHVQIIHGKGTGTLRKMVQDKCNTSSHVASYRLGDFSEGGDGVTIAEIK